VRHPSRKHVPHDAWSSDPPGPRTARGAAPATRAAPEQQPRSTGLSLPAPGAPAVVQPKPATRAAHAARDEVTQQWLGTAARAASEDAIHAAAAMGTSGASGALPHREAIQRSFGGHDVSTVQAHTDAHAIASARAMGAEAFAAGRHVAFASASPSLHTVAHEAAHVVQQRAGVQLAGGVGRDGDRYEQHADAVADLVVQGRSAEALLDRCAGGARAAGDDAAGSSGRPVQMARKRRRKDDPPAPKRGRSEPDEGENEPPGARDAKERRVAQAITYAFWNIERLGVSSDPEKKQSYVDYVVNVLATYHPTFVAFEEMGAAVNEFGKSILESDLIARDRQHGKDKPELDADVDEATEELEEMEDELSQFFAEDEMVTEAQDSDEEELTGVFPALAQPREERRPPAARKDLQSWPKVSYPVSQEYAFLPGPEFARAHFTEYYPLLYDTAVVIGEPELLVSKPLTVSRIRQGFRSTEKLLEPYDEPRPFMAKKPKGGKKQAAKGGKKQAAKGGKKQLEDPRTPRGPAFWRIRMKALPHNTRPPKKQSKEQSKDQSDDQSILELYLGVVHTTPGMLNDDIFYILACAATLVPEGKPVLIGGDWYMQRSAKMQWKKLQNHEVWALGLPHGTTNYKPGKIAQTADHMVFGKQHASLGGTPIRVQEPDKIPYEGLTGIDRDEMLGLREDEDTSKELKEAVGSDHTMILATLTLHPGGVPAPGETSNDPKHAQLVSRLKNLNSKKPGKGRPVKDHQVTVDGKTLTVNTTLGDGNCFYHAVYEALTGQRSTPDAQMQIRRGAVNAMLTDPLVQTHLFGEIPDTDDMWETISVLLEEGAWTEDFTPSFVAEALNLEIHVLQATGESYYTASPTAPRNGLRTIYLVYTDAHYDSCTEQALP
jgi:hypothetical protein